MVLTEFSCTPETLAAAVRRFRRRKVLVLGDVMLDRFIWGSVSRISPEAPVPVVEIRDETVCLGGAANVAANVSSLGGEPYLLSVVGNDAEGEQLRNQLRALGATASGVLVDRERATSVKTRIIAHHQQVCRTDREQKEPISAPLQHKVVEWFRAHLDAVDAVIISDYAKGFVLPSLLRKILPLAYSARKIVCVDPKQRNFAAYRPATILTPNLAEAEHASGMSIRTDKDLARAGRKILRQTGADHLLVTRGERGMAVFESEAHVMHIPTLAREVYDVTGAGDTVVSTLSLGLVAGLSVLAAAVLSNIAAGIVVGKLGTASVTPDELLQAVRKTSSLGIPASNQAGRHTPALR